MLIALVTLAFAADDEKPKWSVDAPPGEAVQVPIKTTEGTWMSVTVHPDGTRLAFDLLGDLYELPLVGGEAKPLTSGMAWDMQPVYDSEGGLVFTSDRGGGDNLWRRKAGETTAITDESFRLLNSPDVHGEWVIGRKHFTKRRSLGAGEIWMYHRSGGDGLQLTEKENDQKDLGEPAFGPEGRFVYWSRDATPGKYFEYNKDSNSGIYVIERLDRDTGRSERIAGGTGGAVRPTPHPNGRHLAYVKRIRHTTVLVLLDIESGRERILWDGLDRDMQETWAIHGVYPRFDWTPDGKALVIWAQGGLWKVSVDLEGEGQAKVQPIPFSVDDTREVRAPVRFPVEVAPERFDVKMLRGVRTSPDGRSVVFEAVGKLWIRPVSGGPPRRLTNARVGRELEPSWSRDGKRIVFVHWTDEGLSTVKTVPSRGGSAKALTKALGHYREPEFTPDGKAVVYRRAEGGWLTSGLHEGELGIYLQPKKGDPILLTRDGITPHFGADGEHLFFLDQGDGLALKSVTLSDRVVQTHVTGEDATDFRVSPNGQWLAWQEQHDVHVRAFTLTGKTESVSASGNAIPQATVSGDAGTYMHFSGDSDTVYWSTGPTLFSTPIATVVGAEDPPDPQEIDLGFDRERDRPKGVVALVGARIIPMTGDTVIEKGTIVWDGDRILAVGSDVEVPAGATVLDGEGKTVIPGLVDVHAHGSQGEDGLIPERNWGLLSSLSFGVTTIHDPSNRTDEIFAASEIQKDGGLLGPRIFSTGTILYGAKSPHATAKINSLEDAKGHLSRMKAVGAFSVKSYNQPRREQRQQVLEAGRQLEIMVVPEGGSLLQHNLTMIVDGHTTIEHSLPVQAVYDDVLQLWSQTQVGYTPTLGVAYGGLMGEEYWYAKTNVWDDERLLTFVPRFSVDGRSRRRQIAPDEEYNHIAVAKFAKRFVDAGGWVNLGAHGQRDGLAPHWELWMFEQGGMTPLEALRSGTLHSAKSLGLDADIGSIEVGKLADFAVLSANPLEDLKNSREVELTVIGGRVYESATMNPIHPPGPSQTPFWFADEAGHWRP